MTRRPISTVGSSCPAFLSWGAARLITGHVHPVHRADRRFCRRRMHNGGKTTGTALALSSSCRSRSGPRTEPRVQTGPSHDTSRLPPGGTRSLVRGGGKALARQRPISLYPSSHSSGRSSTARDRRCREQSSTITESRSAAAERVRRSSGPSPYSRCCSHSRLPRRSASSSSTPRGASSRHV